MKLLLDLGFWYSVEDARIKLFQRKIHLFLSPKKIEKITHFDGGILDLFFHSKIFDFGLHFISIYSCFILLVRPSSGSDKSPRKRSRFFEFSTIIAHKISIDLVSLWCKFFLFLLPISWLFLLLLPRTPKICRIFFHDLENSCKFLRTLPRLIAKILAWNLKNPRNFLVRNPRRQALGYYFLRTFQIGIYSDLKIDKKAITKKISRRWRCDPNQKNF